MLIMEESDMINCLLVVAFFYYVLFLYFSITRLVKFILPSSSRFGGDGNGLSICNEGVRIDGNGNEYKITRVRPDGRCLFRALVHGACLRSGQAVLDETREGELADDLRARVMDELVRRKDEFDQWDLGDLDVYVQRMKKPTVWAGEPELLMASYVLQTPISVFVIESSSGNLRNITNYGQEYEENDQPIKVLFLNYGHYDLLEEFLSDISCQNLRAKKRKKF
ncbi:hypothetical protein MKW98_006167 [Papaver atlanticum]|uniref:Ubiquitin thioesterase OTU n=1 Tax=Papaver atlanticum TaxID=357466 RepID=A0AAD4XXI9_9MAGN|nr:hypothetical protein MKW98_006167 [Papaver atlanticum]